MMSRLPRATSAVCLSILGVALLAAACSPDGGSPTVPPGSGGQGGATGGSPGSGGSLGSGGSSASGGSVGTGGSTATGGGVGSGGTVGLGGTTSSGGSQAAGGTTSNGGSQAAGGTTSSGGSQATGGTSAAGGTTTIGSGGRATGGGTGVGGQTGSGGMTGTTARGGATTTTGGSGGTGTGGTGTGGSTVAIDCAAAMPTSGGTTHCGSDRTGKAGSLSWELWSNANNGSDCITYYSVPAFSAKWSNNGDYLARMGIEWGGKSIASLGEVTAEFTYKKTGSGGGYSYIGVYGWARSPCVEYYIIEDSFNGMPVTPWNMQQKGSATIDGEVYKFFAGTSNGTGGSRCGTPFQQYWSIRQKGRQCGVMTITKHYEEWKKVGMNMDSILEAKVLVETGGGSGTVDFPIANVKSSN
jgi:hypothetical protein